MFSQLHFVRLRSAERALRDGRLEDALRIATAADLRNEQRANQVLAELSRRFLDLAREHFHADRFEDALVCMERAAATGELVDEIQELRQHVMTVAGALRDRDRTRQEQLGAALRRANQGSLAAGRRLLDGIGGRDAEAEAWRHRLDERAHECRDLLQQVERHLAADQLPAALERLKRARSLDTREPELIRLEALVTERIVNQVADDAREGKLRRAAEGLALLAGSASRHPLLEELREVLHAAQEAAQHVEASRYADARRCTMILHRLLPDAPWVSEALELLRELEDRRTSLLAGPLGQRLSRVPAFASVRPGGGTPELAGARNRNLDETLAVGAAAGGGQTDRLLLHVDGGGSYLILPGDRATIGRAVAQRPADIPIFSDLAEQHAVVHRVEDDYFLISSREVEVGGRKTRHHLLCDGQRVVLGKKAKFTFRVPDPKSATATLELSDTTKMPNDVRRVVLFRHHAIIGTGPGAHLNCRHAATPLVLYERGGSLYLRQRSDGHVDGAPVAVELDRPTDLGGVRLVLQRWRDRPAAGLSA
jgi:hypothetical protein